MTQSLSYGCKGADGVTVTGRLPRVRHGPAVAARIGLDRIRAECRHFAAWLSRLESLPALV